MKRIRQIFQGRPPCKWLFCGDSITHGAQHTYGARDYTQHFAEYLRNEGGRSMDVLVNTAISGNTTRELLEGFDWRIGQFAPQVVLLMIGMNDSSTQRNLPPEEFRANLRELVRRSSALGAVVVLQTTCPVIPGNAPEVEQQLPACMDVVRAVAKECGMPLVDHARHWLAQEEFPINWMADAIHPNAFGHVAFAQHLVESLGMRKGDAFLFRMPVPF